MNTAARMAGYAGVLALVFAAAWGLGAGVGAPTGTAAESPMPGHSMPGSSIPGQSMPVRVWQGDGYQVRLDGDLVPGEPSQVFATVSRDGSAVTDLQPFQGTFGRAVAVRTADLTALPVQPATAAGSATRSGPGIAFVADVPAAGTYRLLLDFRHGGAMHTAEFTLPTRDVS